MATLACRNVGTLALRSRIVQCYAKFQDTCSWLGCFTSRLGTTLLKWLVLLNLSVCLAYASGSVGLHKGALQMVQALQVRQS